MINYYWVSIKGKNYKNALLTYMKQNINIYKVIYKKNEMLIKISYEDYQKIKKTNYLYNISIYKTSGKRKISGIYQKYKLSILTFIISIILLIFISNLILFINIDTNSTTLKSLIKNELNKNNISLYTTQKSYKSMKKITKNIKEKNLDKIEWIEFKQKGVVLNVKVIERVNKKNKEANEYKDVVAAKDGYIRKIYSRNGQLLKNIDDYVKKGEIIISGNIYRNDKVVGQVNANGKVYAEVWYIVKADKSLNKKQLMEKKLGKAKLTVDIKDHSFNVVSIPKKIKKEKRFSVFKNNIFAIYFINEKKYSTKNIKYKDQELKNILELTSKKSIEKKLSKDEYIISQKTLKKYIKNDRMYIEVFFRVYEDIAELKDIEKIDNENNKEQ